MPNTKDQPKDQRKTAKRKARKELKVAYAGMTPETRKKFRKSEEKIGLKAFLAKKAEG